MDGPRFDWFFDLTSPLQLLLALYLGWTLDPFIALLVMVVLEPVKVYVIAPVSLMILGRSGGYESWRNAMGDLLLSVVGVAVGHYLLKPQWTAPL